MVVFALIHTLLRGNMIGRLLLLPSHTTDVYPCDTCRELQPSFYHVLSLLPFGVCDYVKFDTH